MKRVRGDVALQVLELVDAADEMVKTFFLPEATVATEASVDLARREFFPEETLGLNLDEIRPQEIERARL